MRISGIYKIQSKRKPSRIYIGSSVNATNRWCEYLYLLKNNKHFNRLLQEHYNRYGESDFQFTFLVGCDRKNLMRTEQFFIDAFDPYFNLNKIAINNSGLRKPHNFKITLV